MAVFHSVIPSLSTQVYVRGKARIITFTPKGRPYSHGYLYCSDRDTVAAIKKHPYFGKYITLEQDDVPVVDTKKETPSKKAYPDVRKTQDAKEILQAEYGYAADDIKSKAAALAAAEQVGISFPNL